MRSICFYFQVHQPFRLRTYRFFDIGAKHNYYDEYTNQFIMQKVAEKSYLPMNELLLKLIKEYGSAFKVSFSITGTALEQFEEYAPKVLESFKKLAATGNVEFLAETYAHSLASLKSQDEFVSQVEKHVAAIEKHFGMKPATFRNTELIYSDAIGKMVSDMGYKLMLTEGAKHVLGWRSPNFMYASGPNPNLKLLLKNFRLSDDIAFRFSHQGWSEWPLTVEKFVNWLEKLEPTEEVVNLFMDYETFGEHQWAETGIFEFMRALPARVFSHSNFIFSTPSELGKKLQPVAPIHVPYPISWADEERDLTAWLGNDLQDEAFDKLYKLEKKVKLSNNPGIHRDWNNLQTSDHFYYMCTKWFSDGAVHEYFNPYGTPYDAFINYMNVLSDFTIRLENENPSFAKEVDELKESASKIVEKGKKYIKVKADVASKKIEKTIHTSAIKFEDIKEMSDAKIKMLIKESDIEDLVGALKDAEKELVDKVIPNLSKKAQKTFDELQKEMKVKKTEIKKYRDSVEKKLRDIFG